MPATGDSKSDGPITPNVFEHLVKLAQFELSDEEASYLRRELNGQMRAIRQLEAIEVQDDVPITSHGVPYPEEIRPEIRRDVARNSELADDILAAGPETEDRFFVVPDIPHEDLT